MGPQLQPKAKHTEPDVALSTQDRQDIQSLYNAMRSSKARLVSPQGNVQHLPESVYQFLTALISELNNGRCVTILQSGAKLTTVEAAEILGVSRQFLVNLLERNDIPYHMVGTHRRIYVRHVMEYKAKRDSGRREALRALAKAEMSDGLYIERSKASGV